jgi:hypothetical protein
LAQRTRVKKLFHKLQKLNQSKVATFGLEVACDPPWNEPFTFKYIGSFFPLSGVYFLNAK